jgi:hypothetical protein
VDLDRATPRVGSAMTGESLEGLAVADLAKRAWDAARVPAWMETDAHRRLRALASTLDEAPYEIAQLLAAVGGAS